MQLHFEAMQYLAFLVKDQILHLVSVAKGTRRPAKAEFAALCETKNRKEMQSQSAQAIRHSSNKPNKLKTSTSTGLKSHHAEESHITQWKCKMEESHITRREVTSFCDNPQWHSGIQQKTKK